MKKIFLLATVMVVAISFWGAKTIESLFQPVPVTEAQYKPTASPKLENLQSPSVSIQILPTATTLSLAALPTLAPVVLDQPTLAPAVVEQPTLAPTIVAQPTLEPTVVVEPTLQPVVETPVATVVAAEAISSVAESNVERSLLDAFIQTVSTNGTAQVTGVYVQDHFSLPVVQQPAMNSAYVSEQAGVVTQFSAASPYGTIGLLAHNFLSGIQFFDLQLGQDVYIIQGNGEQQLYRVTQIERFQALSPTDTYSDFINLSDPAQTVQSAGDVFQQIYTGQNRVVFQTCIEQNGDPSWGRLFVIAEKVN